MVVLESDGTGLMREFGGPLLTEPPRAGPRSERSPYVQSWPLQVPPAVHAEILFALSEANFPIRADNLLRGEAPATIAVTAADGTHAGMVVGSRLLARIPELGAILAEVEQLCVPLRISLPPRSIPNPELASWPATPPTPKKEWPR